ncbi:hypothetical protein [Bacillus sp. SIMBA_005]|uniref:hypothetical protein n=2 Tax=unclassified Bacillus (in: firmicutes) TaxID=185979 RepID=UPI0039784E76
MISKKIGIAHFVYNIIIAILLITFILVLSFGDKEDAGNQINVMATGISIILAVIAILMTLVDVAGQRQSIIDIKETSEKLTITQEKSQETLIRTIKAFEELSGFKEELLDSVATYKNGTEGLIKNLSEELTKKETVSRTEIEEVLKQFNEKSSHLDSKVKHLTKAELSYRPSTSFTVERQISNQLFLVTINSLYPHREQVPLSELKADLQSINPHYFNKIILKELIMDLKIQNFIFRDDEGKEVFLAHEFKKENNKN